MLAQQIQLHKHASKSPAISTRLWCGYWSCSGLWERGTQCRFYCCVLPQIEQIIAKTRTPIMPCCAPSYDSCTTIIWLWGRCNKEKKEKKKKKTREEQIRSFGLRTGHSALCFPRRRKPCRSQIKSKHELTARSQHTSSWCCKPSEIRPPHAPLKALTRFIRSPHSQEGKRTDTFSDPSSGCCTTVARKAQQTQTRPTLAGSHSRAVCYRKTNKVCSF